MQKCDYRLFRNVQDTKFVAVQMLEILVYLFLGFCVYFIFLKLFLYIEKLGTTTHFYESNEMVGIGIFFAKLSHTPCNLHQLLQ